MTINDLRPKGKVAVLCQCGVELYIDPLSPELVSGVSLARCSYCTGESRICPCQEVVDGTVMQTGMDVSSADAPCPRCGETDLYIDPMTSFKGDTVYRKTGSGTVCIGPAAEVVRGLKLRHSASQSN